jgi:hypothetical protein
MISLFLAVRIAKSDSLEIGDRKLLQKLFLFLKDNFMY